MSASTAPSADSGAPTQIWVALNADLQGRMIRLLAQLAFNLLTAQAESSIDKETVYARSTEQSQTSA